MNVEPVSTASTLSESDVSLLRAAIELADL